ncbi:MAG: SGNH/GDSL hydrolase family protein [Bacteroidaceae bacterium]|nr:SGNH/GDSL hydrolase family protein [Bacteroidaceae bacterium]
MKANRLILFVLISCIMSTAALAQRWVGTWTTAQQVVEPHNLPPSPGLSGNSIREIVQLSIGGKTLRLKLSNEYGKQPTEIKAVEIAIAKTSGSSADIVEGTTKSVYFNNKQDVTIAAGEMVVSDPIKYKVGPRENIAITIHYGNCDNKNVTGHPGSRTTSYIAEGNTSDFTNVEKTDHWYNICGIDVVGKKQTRAVAILGNSITDGRGSTTNQQNRWADNLSRSLLKNKATRDVAVLNLGIGGNCVLRGGLGPTGAKRFNRDIMQQEGVKYIIIFEGINDLGGSRNGAETAKGLIEAYTKMIEEAHAKGIKVYGATITPFKGNNYYSPDHEAARSTVNEWIRTCKDLDAVIDFDKTVRNPENTEALQKAFLFENDWLHLNADGYKTMGESIDINLFK